MQLSRTASTPWGFRDIERDGMDEVRGAQPPTLSVGFTADPGRARYVARLYDGRTVVASGHGITAIAAFRNALRALRGEAAA